MRHLQTYFLVFLVSHIPHVHSQNCPSSFDQGSTTISKGATSTNDATKVACEATCRKDTTCLSYQIDSNSDRAAYCWLQRNTSAFDTSNLYLANNIVEYKKSVDCSTCTFTYVQQIGITSLGAQSYPALTTENQCKENCNSLPTCYSYQINSNFGNPLCWIQQKQFTSSDTYSQPGVTEYKKTYSCLLKSDCDPTFNAPVPTNVSIGAVSKQGLSEIECRALCLNDYNCASYQIDLNSNSPLCWIQYDITKFSGSNFYLRAQVTEYFKNTTYCYFPTEAPVISTTSCPLGFSEKPYANASLLATPNATLNTNASCRQACLQDTKCASYQINTAPGEAFCWLQFDEKNLEAANTYTRPNVVEFVKVSICTTTAQTTTITRCPLFYTKYPDNQASYGAQAQASLITSQSCADGCTADPTCLSYQISTKPGDFLCYFQKNSNNLLVQYQNDRVAEYYKNFTCITDCDYYYTAKTPNAASANAVRQAQTSLTTCQSACTITPNCYAFQFNDLDKSCWFQLDASKVNDNYNNPSVTEYVRRVVCGADRTSTSTVATTTATQCEKTFEISNGVGVSIGAEIQSTSSPEACKAGCLLLTNCYSYQIETTSTSIFCWYQKNNDSLQNKYTRTNVIEYTKVCKSTTIASNCTVDYSAGSPASVSINAQRQTYTTVDLCKAACTLDGSCLSYQIDTSSSSLICWFQKTAAELNNKYTRPNVTEYTKFCSNVVPCVPTYVVNTTGFASINALQQSQTNAVDCRNACSSDATCLSYQIETTSTIAIICWFQKSSSELSRIYSRPGVTEYTKICQTSTSSVTTTTVSPPCSSTEYNTTGSGLASIGAVQQQTTDATVCRAQCTLDATCVSYQIETSGTSIICWFQRSSANLQNRYSRPNVIEYIKYCANPTTSVSTISPPCSSTEYNTTGSGLASIGAVQQQTTDATVCRAQCTLDATCVSYQIETSGTSIICWFQRSSANLQNRYSRPNVIEYIKYCANPTTSVSTSTSQLRIIFRAK
ncbi:hypothetical protein HELRODRAFT_169095 [Helobdella robusta]|uniref:Apple domain-containing protein n=1 Tax=Helobdella robusta TaxID=6412 RepID=T1F1E0_HELRO|nr:hypothetical protein HELRODRAFT_169095 [Helobdella robusta]ESO09151.1 hypothetical protein HELRODRAFT_169095 [Helobdella robusta]